jgi:hypothetical protein
MARGIRFGATVVEVLGVVEVVGVAGGDDFVGTGAGGDVPAVGVVTGALRWLRGGALAGAG